MNIASYRRMEKWKIGICLVLVVAIYCMVEYMRRTSGGTSSRPTSETSLRISFETFSEAVATCNQLENIFRRKETQIMEPDLPDVSPIFPKTEANKCIQTVKWKVLDNLSGEEVSGLKHCIHKNANPEWIFKHIFKPFELYERNITFAFFQFLKAKPDVVIVEIGGYTGQLLKKLIPITGAKTYAVLEPVPSFYDNLNTNIVELNLQSSVKTYNFGLGKTNRETSVDIKMDGTSIFRAFKSNKTEKIRIVSVVDFFVQIGVGCNTVDLLTINCEGCEFEILETLLSTTLIEKFNHIQFQPHYTVPTPGTYICRYCRLRELLARTHMIEYQYPHVWESWRKK